MKLVGSKGCPFVHRIQILLNFFKVAHSVQYVDLQEKPEWFLKVSPLGKVPLLVVDEDTILFESSVISEYLEDIATTKTLPAEPVKKAFCRAWIEFGNNLVGSFHRAIWAREENFAPLWEETHRQLMALDDIKGRQGKEFFLERGFGLVDSTYASLFFRIQLVEANYEFPILDKYEHLQGWSRAILNLPWVIESHPEGFEKMWQEKVRNKSRISA